MNDLNTKWHEAVKSYEQNTYDPTEKMKRWKAYFGTDGYREIPVFIKKLIICGNILKEIVRFHPGPVLDLACGNGYFYGKTYEEEGYDYLPDHVTPFGLDVIENKVYPGKRFAMGKAEHLPFKDSCFDGAVCVSAINHFLNPIQAIEEVFRVLKTESMFYVMVNAMDRRESMVGISKNAHHIYEFTPKSLLDIYWDSGFSQIGYQEIIDEGHMSIFWGQKL